MSLNPVFEVGDANNNDDEPLPFDKKLCMFCQKAVVQKSSKAGRARTDDMESFKYFIKKL